MYLIDAISKGGWLAVAVFLAWFIFRIEKRIDTFEKVIQEMKENSICKGDYYRDMAELWKEVRDLRIDIKEIMKYLMEKKS